MLKYHEVSNRAEFQVNYHVLKIGYSKHSFRLHNYCVSLLFHSQSCTHYAVPTATSSRNIDYNILSSINTFNLLLDLQPPVLAIAL